MWQVYKSQAVTVIGLSTGGIMGGDDPARIQTFIDQTGVTFPMAQDFGQSYGDWVQTPSASPFPLDIVIDRQGVVLYVSHEYNPAELVQAIEVDL